MSDLVGGVITYLASQGLGTPGTSLFRQTLPSSPVACTAIIATGGPEDFADPTRRVSFQVLHRNTDIRSAYSMITTVNYLLQDRWNIFPGFRGRVVANAEHGAHFRDEANNPVFPLNYTVYTTVQL